MVTVDNCSLLCVCKGDIATDDRSYEMNLVNAMDVATTNVYFYPRLIPIVSSDTVPVCALSVTKHWSVGLHDDLHSMVIDL